MLPEPTDSISKFEPIWSVTPVSLPTKNCQCYDKLSRYWRLVAVTCDSPKC